MNPDRREQVLESAKYLRNVRPLDPAELADYVEGRPDPSAVRRVLREAAPALGLLERDDGRFEPVPEAPLEPSFDGVARFPERYSDALEDLLVDAFGRDWHAGETGDRLRATVRRLKEAYFAGEAVAYDREVALAYAVYHLPDNYAAVQYVVDELGRVGLLPGHLRVLDVGAGVGGPALGLADYVGGEALLDYEGVEPSAAADVLEAMLAETGPNVHATVRKETAEADEPAGQYDLLLFANVLSELDDPVDVVERLRPHLADDGAVVLLAPADLETSTGLRAVERAVEDGLTVFSPTLRFWPDARPADRGWSFDRRPDLAVPPFQRALDDGSGEFVNVDVQYAHAVLRTDGRRRLDVRADPDRFARMADMDDHVTERVDCMAVKLSHDLAGGAGNPVYKVGDGSERVGHFAVLARETSLNDTLREADYGDVVVLERALVLWNDDEEAYNLVVDDETLVDRIRAP